jgi:hypothetical protein
MKNEKKTDRMILIEKLHFDFFICTWKLSFKNIYITKQEFRNELN